MYPLQYMYITCIVTDLNRPTVTVPVPHSGNALDGIRRMISLVSLSMGSLIIKCGAPLRASTGISYMLCNGSFPVCVLCIIQHLYYYSSFPVLCIIQYNIISCIIPYKISFFPACAQRSALWAPQGEACASQRAGHR